MDRAPAKLPNTTSRLIAMAIVLVGDAEDVRRIMGAADEDFAGYRSGDKEPPWQQFDRLIELIMARQREHIAESRRRLQDLKQGKPPPKASA
jgi:hypothetical protein